MTDTFYTQAEVDALLKPINAAIAKLQSDVQALQQRGPLGPPQPPSSPEGTKITPGAGSIVDANGDTWTLAASLLIQKNGAGAYNGWQSREMIYHAGTVYILGLDGNWYRWTGSAFARAAAPPPGA